MSDANPLDQSDIPPAFSAVPGSRSAPEQSSGRSPLPSHIGEYEILSFLGAGGMGIVYEARQPNLGRSVALKVIKPELLSKEVLGRFEHEAFVLGRLDHPGIARIYEAGEIPGESGPQPFFAMELIRGVPLTAYADQQQLSTNERLELLAKICDAVQYAHQQGIVHRDLKPGNILVDSAGQPKILDFGIAKATDADVRATLATEVGQLVGTLAYMSPEQTQGALGTPDTRSDIYALGVIAFELLTGRLPFNLREKMVHEAVRVIQQDEPTRLSAVNPTYRGDVETIVGKAMEKDSSRRYQAASELGTDIRHYLSDEPISARAPSASYQIKKFIKRHKLLTGAATAILLAIGLGLIGTSWGLARANREKTRALGAEAEARKQRDAANQASLESRHRLIASDVNHGVQLMDVEDDFGAALWFTEALRDSRGLPEMEVKQRIRLGLLLRSTAKLDLLTHEKSSWGMVSPDGQRLVVATEQKLSVWDVKSRRQLWQAEYGGVYYSFFSADSQRLVTASNDHTAREWDANTGKQLAVPMRHDSDVLWACFSPDGHRIATASDDHTARVWNSENGEPVTSALRSGDVVYGVSFSADGSHVVTSSKDCTARVFEVSTGLPVAPPMQHKGVVWTAWFNETGSRVLTACQDGGAHTWDVRGGLEVFPALRHEGGVINAWYSPDYKSIITVGDDKKARLWDAIDGHVLCPPMSHGSRVVWASFSHDGRRIVTGCADGKFQVWDAIRGVPLMRPVRLQSAIDVVAFLPDDRHVMIKDETVRIWELPDLDASPTLPLLPHEGNGWDSWSNARISPDGLLAMALIQPQTLQIWNNQTGKSLGEPITFDQPVRPLGFSLDHSAFAAIFGADKGPNEVRVLSVVNGKPLTPPLRHPDRISSMNFFSDGKKGVSASDDGIARVWNTETGALLTQLNVGRPVTRASFGKTVNIVTTCNSEGTLQIWDTQSAKLLFGPLPHSDEAPYLWRFDPLGERLFSFGWGGTGRIWDLKTAKARVLFSMPPVHPEEGWWISDANFSSDGKLLLVAQSDGEVRLWDTQTFESIVLPMHHDEKPLSAHIASDASIIWTTTRHHLRVWDVATGQPLSPPFHQNLPIMNASISEDHGRLILKNWGREKYELDIRPEVRSTEDLLRDTQLLSGRKIDSTGYLLDLKLGAIRDLWER